MPPRGVALKYLSVIDHEEYESAGADLILRWFNLYL
jgi:hypothetical protein